MTELQTIAKKLLGQLEAQEPVKAYEIMHLEQVLGRHDKPEQDVQLVAVLVKLIDRYYNGESFGLILLDLSVALNYSMYETMPEHAWNRLRKMYNP